MKKAAFIILSMLLAVSLAACQPTPEKPAAADKNGALEKIIAQPAVTGSPAPIPDSWQEELQFQNGTQVTVDAKIEKPDVSSYPVISATPHKYTLEDAQYYADILMQGRPIYEYSRVRTKSAVEKDIIDIKAQMENTKNMQNVPEDKRQSVIEDLNQQLQSLETEYQNAPDKEPEKVPATLQFKDDSQGNHTIMVEADLGESVPAVLIMTTSDDGMGSILTFSNTGANRNYNTQVEVRDSYAGMTLSRREAQDAAEKFLKNIGLTCIQLADTSSFTDPKGFENEDASALADNPEVKKDYQFQFSKVISGIPVTCINSNYGLTYSYEAEYDKTWPDEVIDVRVDDGGVYGFLWGGAGDTGQVLNENVEMLGFDSIKELFRKQIFYQRTWSGPTYTDSKITVRKVKLGFMRIELKENEYVYVPVWDFIGDWTYTDTIVNEPGGIYNVSFLTINAIDGSTINRNQGY